MMISCAKISRAGWTEPMMKLRDKFVHLLPVIVLFAAIIALWQAAVTYGGLKPYLLPSPKSVGAAMFNPAIDWWGHIWATGLAILGAFLLAAGSGVLLGTMIAWSPLIAGAL